MIISRQIPECCRGSAIGDDAEKKTRSQETPEGIMCTKEWKQPGNAVSECNITRPSLAGLQNQ